LLQSRRSNYGVGLDVLSYLETNNVIIRFRINICSAHAHRKGEMNVKLAGGREIQFQKYETLNPREVHKKETHLYNVTVLK
jgi:hypothetical protein